MSTIEDIEEAVAALSGDDYARFRAWFDQLDADRFDARIARDAATGKLDALADRAVEDYREGKARDL